MTWSGISCGLDVERCFDIAQRKDIDTCILNALKRSLAFINAKKTAIIAPGKIAKTINCIFPDIPSYSTDKCPETYDNYIACSNPFSYLDVYNSIQGKNIDPDRLVYPFSTDIVQDILNVKKTIDTDKWDLLRSKYKSDHKSINSPVKYFDLDSSLATAFYNTWHAGLHNKFPMNILDIGTGACLLPLVSKYYGHNPYGLDRSKEHIPNCYIDIANLLGITVFYNDISTPFTGFGGSFQRDDSTPKEIVSSSKVSNLSDRLVKFDYVTAIASCFSEGWSRIDYQYFFNSLRGIARNNGIYFFINPNQSSLIASEVFPAILNTGAEIMKCTEKNGFITLLQIYLK